MIEVLKKLTAGVCALVMLSGCATLRSDHPADDEHLLIGGSGNNESRTRNTILVISGILILGAVIANEIDDNVDDAIRDAARP